MIWVSDVFAWRGSPAAAWTEALIPAQTVHLRTAMATESKRLRRLDDDPAVVVLTCPDGETLTAATATEHQQALQGPFAGERTT
jgi:hypothetical protein